MLAWYSINKKYIASTLCINRYKPQLKCNGKCFLAKKIKEAEKNQEENSGGELKQWAETVPCTAYTTGFEIKAIHQQKVYSTTAPASYSFVTGNSIFHPPA